MRPFLTAAWMGMSILYHEIETEKEEIYVEQWEYERYNRHTSDLHLGN